MKLLNPTDNELNAAVAEFVAGWRCHKEQRGEFALCVCYEAKDPEPWTNWRKEKEAADKARYTPISCIEAVKIGFFGRGLPRFTHSADAVLPLLDERGWSFNEERTPGILWVAANEGIGDVGAGHGPIEKTFPFAKKACIALLRAHGVEVEFTT